MGIPAWPACCASSPDRPQLECEGASNATMWLSHQPHHRLCSRTLSAEVTDIITVSSSSMKMTLIDSKRNSSPPFLELCPRPTIRASHPTNYCLGIMQDTSRDRRSGVAKMTGHSDQPRSTKMRSTPSDLCLSIEDDTRRVEAELIILLWSNGGVEAMRAVKIISEEASSRYTSLSNQRLGISLR